jgi:hypothetical protein
MGVLRELGARATKNISSFVGGMGKPWKLNEEVQESGRGWLPVSSAAHIHRLDASSSISAACRRDKPADGVAEEPDRGVLLASSAAHIHR